MIVIGSIISAYGITLAIGAGFGGATLAILWQGLTNVTGMCLNFDIKYQLISDLDQAVFNLGVAYNF